MDQRIDSFTAKVKSNKWTMAALNYVLDKSRVKVSPMYALKNKLNPKQIDSFNFVWDLAESLIIPFAQQRFVVGLSRKTVEVAHSSQSAFS